MGCDVKVVLDPGRCEGNAICCALAPEVFEMNDDDVAEVILGDADESLRPSIQRAVDSCPRMAIRIQA
jgi:ferredoxin